MPPQDTEFQNFNCGHFNTGTFRMGVLLPNYPEENIVKGENVPNFTSVTSTVFESKDEPTQMTKAVIYNYILYYIQENYTL